MSNADIKKPNGTLKKLWKCDHCKKEFERLNICWAEDLAGNKVAINDYFCPGCNRSEVVFTGTKEQDQLYWAMECGG